MSRRGQQKSNDNQEKPAHRRLHLMMAVASPSRHHPFVALASVYCSHARSPSGECAMATITDLRERFDEVVSNEEELRAVVGEPPPHSVAKVITAIDDVARTFIEHAPFAFIASAGQSGLLDISPKGDLAGFVKVFDDHTLAIPDRLGNRRLDTFHNVLRNPNVGIIFLIPGVTHTLRVSGKAIIVRDDILRDSMKVNGKAPNHVMVVGVEGVFSHCSRCMMRS